MSGSIYQWSRPPKRGPRLPPGSGARVKQSAARTLKDADFLQVARDAGMDQRRVGRRGGGVGGGRFLGLVELLRELGFALMQRPRQAIADLVGEAGAREDKRPRAHRIYRLALAGIGAGRHGERLEESVLGADLRRFGGARRDEAAAGLRDARKAGPADPAAPQRRGAAV